MNLASRMVRRRLLYAFASADGNYLDHAAICRALWQCDYAPMHHGSSIKSSVRRLRDLLKGTRAVIQTDVHGYDHRRRTAACSCHLGSDRIDA